MTRTYGEKATCAICGTSAMYDYLGSTNCMGAPDLDGRPSEMERSTMGFWLHICRKCKYVAPKISDEIKGAKEIVESAYYKIRLNQEEYPKLANLFLCQAMILRHAGLPGPSGMACLRAAWVCDDQELGDKAIECRKTAALDIRRAEHFGQPFTEAILIDILRRSEQFGGAGTLCIEALTGEGKDELALKVLAFQRDLIEQKDTQCYTLDDVEK